MISFNSATTRRELLAGSGAALVTAVTAGTAFAAFEPSESYPDPRIEALDPKFDRLRIFSAGVERLATGMRWCEGPVWFGDGRHLLWSDIPNNRMMKWEEETGAVSVFRRPSNYANGNTRDRQGRLVTCEHMRRVTRTEYDGSIIVLIDRFEGKRLNSPNDVVVKSDGSVWFTDPLFGILANYEGRQAQPELPQNIYRLDPETRETIVVAAGIKGPNGLCFSPDESRLYLVESRGIPNRNIRVYDVGSDGGTLSGGDILIDAGPDGTPDGILCDIDGNLWFGWGMGRAELDGVMLFTPEGKPLGRIALPERCANLCFGGTMRNRLFMAASQSIYALYTATQGVPGG